MKPGLLLDRDGVINEEVEYLHDPRDLVMIPGVAEAIAVMNRQGIPVVVITNQAGIGRGMYAFEAYQRVSEAIAGALAASHAHIDAWYFCPHPPEARCECRKPRPGMLLAAARELRLSLVDSVFVGDKTSDLEAARAAGCRSVLVRTGYGRDEELRLARQGRGELVDHAADSLREAVPWLLQVLTPIAEQASR